MKKLGADHPDTLTTLNDLARAYEAAGKLPDAIELFEHVRDARVEKLGADHLDTLTTLQCLAGAYEDACKVPQAIELFEQVRDARMKKQGAGHPATLATLDSLAGAYREAGKLPQAIKLLEQVRDARVKKLGADHPDTLRTLNGLASAYEDTGKLPQAIELYEQVRDVRVKKLGADHPDTLATLNNLALAYQLAGELPQALPLFEQAAAGTEKRNYLHEFYAGDIIPNAIRAYEAARQFDKAEAWRRKWLAVVKQNSGVVSVAYAAQLASLALDLFRQKKYAEAELILRECLDLREKLVQKKQAAAWPVANVKSMLGEALLGQNKPAEAEPLLLAGYKGLKQDEKAIPEKTRDECMTEAIQRLIVLATDTSKPDNVKKWQAELAKYPAQKPAEKTATPSELLLLVDADGKWKLPPNAPAPAVAPFGAVKAQGHQAAWAKHLGVPVEISNSIGMKLVLIPPGEFEMGSPEELIQEQLHAHEENDWYRGWYRQWLSGEGPAHRVRITKPFWLGVTQVTQEDYERVMGSNPSYFHGDTKRPVEQVSWDDAMEFCRRLSVLPGEQAAKWRYDLPTEAQWEYACRAGSSTRFSFGDDEELLGEYGWSRQNSSGVTHRVSQKRPNAWGLYDMQGNLSHWCHDWYEKDYYTHSPTDDPGGPVTGSGHIVRGGGWFDFTDGCRAAYRRTDSATATMHIGFRVCLVPAEKPVGQKTVPSTESSVLSKQASARIAPNAPVGHSQSPVSLPPPAFQSLVDADGKWNIPRNAPAPAVAPFDAVKAQGHQAAWAKHLGVPVDISNSIGMKLVLIPPGEFEMGSPEDLIQVESRVHDDDGWYRGWYRQWLQGEGPAHRVRITKPFWLGVTQVTQEDYERVMGSNPSYFHGDTKRPVEQVSWDDAMEFCRRLSALPLENAANWRYDLPTEAQWEYACRAGSSTRYSFGDDEKLLGEYGWSRQNSGGYTHRVGQKRANAWGLYDMQGNLAHWCRDWYQKEYYAVSPRDDPGGPPAGLGHVSRCGGWFTKAGGCRAAFRVGYADASMHIGFRVVLVPAEKPDGQKTAMTTESPVPGREAFALVAPTNNHGKPLMAETAKENEPAKAKAAEQGKPDPEGPK